MMQKKQNTINQLYLLFGVQQNCMTKQKQQKSAKAEETYKQILKQQESSWQIIKNLNKLYKVDRILLKHAYDTYPQKQSLESSNQFKIIDKFYKYVFKNLFEIEKSYLKVPQQEEGSTYNYQINKNSITKFIWDESQHYKKTLEKHSKINQDERYIKASQIYKFIMELFKTEYTAVIIDGVDYFQSQSRAQQLKQSIKNYWQSIKEINQSLDNFQSTMFTSEQLLDFLSFWIKQKQKQYFYLLYARTSQKLSNQIKYLENEAKNIKQKHSNQALSHPALIKQLPSIDNAQNDQNGQIQIQNRQQLAKGQQKGGINSLNIFEKYRQNNKNQTIDEPNVNNLKIEKKPLTKRQQLDLMTKQLFLFGCKRRYPLPKGTTFDQIEAQSKTMNLEKFINFCNYYSISNCLSRQLLCEMFKLYALNRLTLDETRFRNILSRMIETDANIINCFFTKDSPQKKYRQKVKLSEYKFKLRPVNGKSIETVTEQLGHLKTNKQKQKNQKLKKFSQKKMKGKQPYLKKQKNSNSSYLFPSKASIFQLDSFRDDSFDPQKFFGRDTDDLLSAYESKIQKKQKGLQSVLSRRLEKGDKVLQKVTNTNRNLQLYL